MRYLFAILLALSTTNLFAKELLVVGADWCPACVSLKRFIEQDAKDIQEYDVEIIDIDKHPEIYKSLKIKLLPTSFIFEDGKIISKKQGFRQKDYTDWLRNNK